MRKGARHSFLYAITFIALVLNMSGSRAAELKENVLDGSYSHDYWETKSDGLLRNFRAYTSSFDVMDDNNGDKIPDAWGVPKWVSYQIKRTDVSCIKTHERPSSWITDLELFQQGLMPKDESYAYPKTFTKNRKDWYSRGHLAMKMHAERLGSAAAWNTHIFYNAVPQRQLFNAGIWQDMEDYTAAWAQQYGEVWIITGPIFADKSPAAYLGEKGELPVAIPDALFKVVIKKGNTLNKPDVLAFIYPQVGPSYYRGKPFDHSRFTTTIDEIEKLTGVDFLTKLPNNQQAILEKTEIRKLWDVSKDSFIRACNSQYND